MLIRTKHRNRLLFCLFLLAAAGVSFPLWRQFVVRISPPPLKRILKLRPAPKTFGDKLAYAAEDIIDSNIIYDPEYVNIPYPGGDVQADRGVCADVIIRAYRRLEVDLQELVHKDMSAHFSDYPKTWGLHRPDANIDHRRVFNLATFFRRNGTSLPCTTETNDYLPGDVVAWRLGNQGHIGIVSSMRNWKNTRYLVVHNIGAGQVAEDVLFAFPIIGHYRYKPS